MNYNSSDSTVEIPKPEKAAEWSRKRLENESDESYKLRMQKINNKFDSSIADRLEEEFKKTTVGLVTRDEYKRKLNEIYALEEKRIQSLDGFIREKDKDHKEKNKEKKKEKSKIVLSFEDEEADEAPNGEEPTKKKAIKKNPEVDTSFLPDKERDRDIAERKRQILDNIMARQENIKNEILETKYYYWDGLNVIKTMKVKKRLSIAEYIDECRLVLKNDIPDLRRVTPDNLMCVIDDYIIPSTVSFYELIVSKKEGQCGLLIEEKKKENEDFFEMINKPIKIVDRKIYEKNKHIFPCKVWKQYEPLDKIEPVF